MHRFLHVGLLLSVSIPWTLAVLTNDGRFLRRALTDYIPTKQESEAIYALDAIYKGKAASASETEAAAERAHKDVYNHSGDAAASVYGEIQPSAVVEMLKVTNIREGQKYYDLGSGYGKTVVLAWLLGLNATGVELAAPRWEESCHALKRAPEVGVSGPGNGINFVQSSFLDIDFSDADLVFMDSVMFGEETMKELSKACRRLRPGTKIVSSHMGLPGPGFKKIGELHGAVSWTHRESRWTIQEVASSLADAVDSPAPHKGKQAKVCTI